MKKLRLFTYFVIFSGILLINGCTSTSYVSINVLNPSRSPIPKEIRNVVVVSNKELPTESKEYFAAQVFLSQMKESFNSIGKIYILNPDSLLPVMKYTTQSQRDTIINTMCRNYGADAILIIQDLNVTPDRVFSYGHARKGKDGSVILLYGDTDLMNLTISSTLKLYQKGTSDEVDSYAIYKTQSLYSTQVLTPKEISNAIGYYGLQAIEPFINRLNPKWSTELREYYGSGNSELEKARRLMQRDKWDEATAIWNKLTTSDNKKIQKRAFYNMALAAELKGSYRLAFYWLDKAMDAGAGLSSAYEKKLLRRLKASTELNKELGQ